MVDTPISVGAVQNPYRQFPFTLAANEPAYRIFYTFNFFRILSCSDPTAIQVRFGQTGSFTDIVGAGIGYDLNEAVGEVTFRNTTASPVTVVLGLAVGRIYDDRLNIAGSIQLSNSTTIVTGTTSVGVAAALAVAANSSRRQTVFRNMSGSNTIYLGDSSVTTANGMPVYPGESCVLDTGADIYAIASGASSTLNFLEIRN